MKDSEKGFKVNKVDVSQYLLAPQQLQAYLVACGCDVGPAGLDGKIGSKTREAMSKFAKDAGLDSKDGRYAIEQALSNRVQAFDSSHFEKFTKKVLDGTASPTEIKIAQWVLYGKGIYLEEDLLKGGRHMSGVAGSETKNHLQALQDGYVLPQDSKLRKFYESLTPEQRAMQRRMAELGGVNTHSETQGIGPDSAERMAYERRTKSDIYEGGYRRGTGGVELGETYRPSKEVLDLQHRFDESIQRNPRQKELLGEYTISRKFEDIRANPDPGGDRRIGELTRSLFGLGAFDHPFGDGRDQLAEVRRAAPPFVPMGPR